jgi:hypothetical protein
MMTPQKSECARSGGLTGRQKRHWGSPILLGGQIGQTAGGSADRFRI